ncbi:MAG: T9SS type A sorting domain-containing protein [Bacteroidota bacterium]
MKIKISLKQGVSETIKQKGKIALAAAMGGFAIFTFVIFFTYYNVGISKTAIAAPGKDGSKTIITPTAILNEYTSLTSDAAAGVNKITVANAFLNSNGRFPSNLSSGDLVMIIQTKGPYKTNETNFSPDLLNSPGNSGNFEFAEVWNVPSATKIILKSRISKSYSSSGNVQVIRVPRLSTLTINSSGSVTAPAWDGTTGGVLALEVNGSTIINGSIDVSGLGFRGEGFQNNCLEEVSGEFANFNSAKDSFVASSRPALSKGDECFSSGDFAKQRIDHSGRKIFMDGGGIVYLISYGSVSGQGAIYANGLRREKSMNISPNQNGNGLSSNGGSIFIYTKGTAISNLNINARGSAGGSGGYICTTNNNSLTLNVSGGKTGTIALSPLNPYSSGGDLLVELLRFNETVKEGKVQLTWATSAEINNDYFTIEKSTDGIHFSSYGKIEGAGNTTTVQEYSFDDLHPSEGLNYYRLKQTEFNGRAEYFKIISIDFRSDAGSEFEIKEIHPNPFKENFTIEFNSGVEANCELQLLDIKEKIVAEEKINAYAGFNKYHFTSGTKLLKGIYYARLVKDNISTKSLKLVKQ